MAPKANLTRSANIEVRAREIDFVTRFGDTWESLREILSIMRMIKKENGACLKTKRASIVLEDGRVGMVHADNIREEVKLNALEAEMKANNIEFYEMEDNYLVGVTKKDNLPLLLIK